MRKAGNGRGILRVEEVQEEVTGALGHRRMSEDIQGPFTPSQGSAKLVQLFDLTQCARMTALLPLSITDRGRNPLTCSPASPEVRSDLAMTGPAVNMRIPQITALLEESSAKYE